MPIKLSEVNAAVSKNAAEYIAFCDGVFQKRIGNAVRLIAERMSLSPIVLLSGPTGSGKTTSALMIAERLQKLGIESYAISLDDYFNDVVPGLTPQDENGGYDFESPLCLDLPLLYEHFDALSAGEGIDVPVFDFPAQIRMPGVTRRIEAGHDRIVIFEGIHALGKLVSDSHDEATRVFVNAASDVVDDDGQPCFYSTRLRMARRLMRDHRTRGASAEYTLELWDNVRKNEKANILPCAETANIVIDSTHGYEMGLMRAAAMPLLKAVAPEANRYEQIVAMREKLELFLSVDPALVPAGSLVREFIGGSAYTAR